MEKENFGAGDTGQMEDSRLKDAIKLIIDRNRDVVKLVYDNSNKENLEEEFVAALFSNLKLKIVESLAEEMGIENPKSKEAWRKVTEKYPLEKLEELANEAAREEFKTWTYRQHETSN